MDFFKYLYLELLYRIVCWPGITRPALLLISRRPETIYELINRGIANGHIAVYTAKPADDSRAKTYSLFALTSSGMEYLREHEYQMSGNYIDQAGWIIALYPPSRILWRPSEYNSARLAKASRISSASMVMAICGAEVAVSPLPRGAYNAAEQARCDLYCDVIEDANNDFENWNCNNVVSDDLHYYNAFQVKNKINKIRKLQSNVDVTRYVGILEGKERAWMIYYDLGTGLPLSKRFVQQEWDSFLLFGKNYFQSKTSGFQKYDIFHAIVLVENPRAFQMMFDKYEATNLETSELKLLNSLIVFEVSRGGVSSLKLYVTGQQTSFITDAIDHALNSIPGMSSNNTVAGNWPLIYQESIPVFNGFILSAYSLAKNKTFSSVKGKTIGIICFDWQVPYYQRIRPNAIFFPFKPPEL